jgi:hypothetical protein
VAQRERAERHHQAREHGIVERGLKVETRLGVVQMMFVVAQRTATGSKHLTAEARYLEDHGRVVEGVQVDQVVERPVDGVEAGALLGRRNERSFRWCHGPSADACKRPTIPRRRGSTG